MKACNIQGSGSGSFDVIIAIVYKRNGQLAHTIFQHHLVQKGDISREVTTTCSDLY
jgi:hypothetical protein